MEQTADNEERAREEERFQWERRIKSNVLGTLNSMDKIREDCIFHKLISEYDKQPYFRLAGELASGLNEMRNLDPMHNKIDDKITNVFNSVIKDKSLLTYDPLHDSLQESNPNVMHNLNELLISIVEDKFSTTKENYHILQAIKLFDKTENKKILKALQESISPMQIELEVKNDALWKRFGAFFLGETYDLEKVDESTLKIKSDITLSSLDALISKLDGKGYSTLRVDVPREYQAAFFKKYPEAKNTNTEDVYSSRRGKGVTMEVDIPLGDKKEMSTKDILNTFEEFRQKYSESLSDYLARCTLGPISISEYFASTRFYNLASVSIDNCLTHVFPDNQDGVAFSNIKKIDDFTKYSILMYKNAGKKLDEYLLTAITSDYTQDKVDVTKDTFKLCDEDVMSLIINTLTGKDETAMKLETLASELAPNYIRLRKFNGNTLVKDYGGVGWYD